MDNLNEEIWQCIEDMVYGNVYGEGVFEGVHYCYGDCNPYFYFEEEKFENDTQKCKWYNRLEEHLAEVKMLANEKIKEIKKSGVSIRDYLDWQGQEQYEPKSERDMMDLGLYERWDPY